VLLPALMLAMTFARLLAANPGGEQYVIRAWGVEEGLSQNFVTAVVQTRDRYLWLGTYGGLTRFDGVAFSTFGSGTTHGILSDRILGLCEDSAGTLWIATEDAGLTQYANGTFTTYTVRDGPPSNFVRAVLAGRDGEIWAATLNGLARRRGQRFEAVELGTDVGNSDILSLRLGKDGRLLIGTNRGMAEWKDGHVAGFHAVSDLVLSVFEDHQQNIWLGTSDGVYVLNRNGAARRIPQRIAMIGGEVRAILEDSGGAL
jgi:ligand-binding sensor domain-containing protein